MKQEKYKVSVKCFTYNQASYIEETLNGFCMQETKFPFVCVIIDDASTDDEADVIRKYMNANFSLLDNEYLRQEETDDYVLTFAQHRTNKNCFFSTFYLKYNHRNKKNKEQYAAEWLENSSYIAICEGDDYWVDPYKLQKQVEVLEDNPDISMVYTSFKTVDENSNIVHRPRYDRYIKRSHTGNILPELYYSNFILTLTTMLRREILYSDLYLNCPNKYDYVVFFSAAFMGQCYYIHDVTGCYRKNEGSYITSRFQEVEKGLYKAYLYFVERFLNDEYSVKCGIYETTKIYRNMLVNLFFHNNYQYIYRLISKNALSIILVPEAFVFSLLKKIKWRTYGSIDR